jgi:hypothetical protein
VAHQPPDGQSDNPVIDLVVLAMAGGILLAAGVLTALPRLLLRRGKDHSALAGLAEVMWGVLLSGPAAFIANVLTTTRGAIATELPAMVFDAGGGGLKCPHRFSGRGCRGRSPRCERAAPRSASPPPCRRARVRHSRAGRIVVMGVVAGR